MGINQLWSARLPGQVFCSLPLHSSFFCGLNKKFFYYVAAVFYIAITVISDVITYDATNQWISFLTRAEYGLKQAGHIRFWSYCL